MSAAPFAARLARAHEAMSITGVDALLLSLGADLPWLSGYVAMPLERLTMLVVPAAGGSEQATLVVPALEAPRVTPVPEVFSVRPWGEMEDPVEIVASLVRRFTGKAPALAISDRAWATFLLQLERALPDATWRTASTVTAPLRAIKDAAEVEALAKAAAAADRVAAALLGGEIALVQRTEREVSAELSRRLLEEGNEKVNFAIVGSGPIQRAHTTSPASVSSSPGNRLYAISAERLTAIARISHGQFLPANPPGSWRKSTESLPRPKPPG